MHPLRAWRARSRRLAVEVEHAVLATTTRTVADMRATHRSFESLVASARRPARLPWWLRELSRVLWAGGAVVLLSIDLDLRLFVHLLEQIDAQMHVWAAGHRRARM